MESCKRIPTSWWSGQYTCYSLESTVWKGSYESKKNTRKMLPFLMHGISFWPVSDYFLGQAGIPSDLQFPQQVQTTLLRGTGTPNKVGPDLSWPISEPRKLETGGVLEVLRFYQVRHTFQKGICLFGAPLMYSKALPIVYRGFRLSFKFIRFTIHFR